MILAEFWNIPSRFHMIRAVCLLAEKILPECGFTKEEEREILAAISSHRKTDILSKIYRLISCR